MSTVLKKKLPKKDYSIRVRTRHPSHHCLRRDLPRMPFRCVIRLGSTTELDDVVSEGGNIVEINTVDAVKNSANKRLMKKCFTTSGIRTAEWFLYNNNKFLRQSGSDDEPKEVPIEKLPYPIVIKNIYGSRGTGGTN